mmetsp:Transcript_141519/g.246714  ORF Transcript_141519/g.246714 Transcript_141519/m.246714 type:complete len:163 (-) Transcript_141519:165-653(-)
MGPIQAIPSKRGRAVEVRVAGKVGDRPTADRGLQLFLECPGLVWASKVVEWIAVHGPFHMCMFLACTCRVGVQTDVLWLLIQSNADVCRYTDWFWPLRLHIRFINLQKPLHCKLVAEADMAGKDKSCKSSTATRQVTPTMKHEAFCKTVDPNDLKWPVVTEW